MVANAVIIAEVPTTFAAPPAVARTLTFAPPPAAPVTCDGGGISADLGQALQVVRCFPGWACVTTGNFGDASSLDRLVGDSWTRTRASRARSAAARRPPTVCRQICC
jgi:hypothetical protein